MSEAREGRLSIDADLDLSIDGVQAALVGEDSQLTLRTDAPAQLTRALRRSGLLSAGRTGGASLPAGRLDGVSVTVEGPRGPVLRVGPGRGVRLRALPRGTRVQVHRPQDLVSRRAVWIAAAVTAIVAALLWRRAGSTPDG